MEKKFFFFDIDNTLITWPEGILLESTKEALRILKEKGHLLGIATGRIQQDAVEYGKMAGIDNVVADGGYSVTIDEKLIHMRPLETKSCHYLLEQLEDNQIPWAIVLDNKIERFTPHNNLTGKRVAPWDYFKTIYCPEMDFRKMDKIFKIFIYLSREDEAKYKIDYGTLEHVRYGEESILIEPMDKSVGIRYIADYYNIPYENIVTFGDGRNDIRMFEPIWTNIAMGNGDEELKSLASYVTDDTDHDGIYKACRHYGWVKDEDLKK